MSIFTSRLLNIFLVGQIEVEEMLLEERNKAFRQRITINHRIKHLTAAETRHYIAHRLRVAGYARGIFTAGACERILEISDGIPCLINSVCECALLSGFVKNKRVVDQRLVDACQAEFRIPLGPQRMPEPK
jgi:general secretion pathway protein A